MLVKVSIPVLNVNKRGLQYSSSALLSAGLPLMLRGSDLKVRVLLFFVLISSQCNFKEALCSIS